MDTQNPNPSPAAVDRASITQLVLRFYDDVRTDRLLGPTFDAVLCDRRATHLPRMVEFWSTVMLGSRSFNGNVFARHTAVSGVTQDYFGRWLRLWALHTQVSFDRDTARRLQAVASGIARQLDRGYFGHTAGFEVVDPEACHG